MRKPITVPALGDNLIYVLPYYQDRAIVVDPGQGGPVLQVLEAHHLTVTAIFVTHHHYDHTAAVAELKKHTACRIIGPDGRVPQVDLIVDEIQTVKLNNTEVRIIFTPGHTGTSVCYYITPASEAGTPILFTGDTLFVGGCGRVLETAMETMYASTRRLAALPPETLVYPGHDYTEENYRFALTVLPDDPQFRRRLDETQEAVRAGRLTIPSTMAEEKKSNVFLRASQRAVKNALDMPDDAPAMEVFAELRRRKDLF